MRKWLAAGIAAAGLGLAMSFAGAQDAEKSRFVRFVENQLSTPDRQIRLGPIEGVLSSDVRLQSISIADKFGVWLRVEDVELEWSRFALLRGRLEVERLEAASITISRKPLPSLGDDDEDDTEGGAFEVPELPVSVNIEQMRIGTVPVAEDVVGPAFSLGLDGRVRLAGGELDAALSIERQDQPGALTLETKFDNESRQLTVKADISEPSNGVVANALNIQGRPSVDLRIDGDGPLSDFTADVNLSTDGTDALTGTVRLTDTDDALALAADFSGDFSPLVVPRFQPLVAGGSSLTVRGARAADGGITLDTFQLDSGAANLSLSGALAADFAPIRVALDATIAQSDGSLTPLISVEGGTVDRVAITGALGGDIGDTFRFDAEITELDTPFLVADRVVLTASGDAVSLSDPEARRLTFNVEGGATGLERSGGAVAAAFGDELSVAANGSLEGTGPVTVTQADVRAATFAARFAGTIGDGVDGSYQLRAEDLSAFSMLAGRDLAGTISLDAAGQIGFDATADLRLDGAARDLSFDTPTDGLLAGRLRLSGRAARTSDGVLFDNFSFTGDALSLTANGSLTTGVADLRAALELADIGALRDDLSGSLTADLSAAGQANRPGINVRLVSPNLTVGNRSIELLSLAMEGVWQREASVPTLSGDLSFSAQIDGAPAFLEAAVATDADQLSLSDLAASIAGATLQGDITRANDVFNGQISARVPDLGPLAALGLMEAAGSLNADITLSDTSGTQAISAVGNALGIEVAGAEIGSASFDLSVDDAFAIPLLDGSADLRAAKVAGFDVRTLILRARRDGTASTLTARGDVAGASLAAEGALERRDTGFVVDLQSFSLERGDDLVRLEAPTRLTKGRTALTLDETRLALGTGSARLLGAFGDRIDIFADLSAVPLSIANLVRPDLGLSGTVNGKVTANGTPGDVTGEADIQVAGVSAAELSRRGIDPLDVQLAGTYAADTFTIRDGRAAISGGTLSANGTVGDTLDLTVAVRDLPLALANAAAGDLGISGTLDADAQITGQRDDPRATFSASTRNASAAPLRAAGLDALTADVAGRYADGTATLDTATASVGGGRVDATGTVGQQMNLSATITSLPLALADAVAPDVALRGALSGQVNVAGTPSAPRVDFQLDAGGVSAAPLATAGVGALSVSADGRFAQNTVTLSQLDANGSGLSLTADGLIPLNGPGLRLRVVATAPLSLANRFLAERGASADGEARADLRISGSLARPDVRGTATATNMVVRDPQTGVVLENGRASAELVGDAILLREVSAELGGGVIALSGRIGLGPGLPGDLTVRFTNARYADGRLVAVTLSGELRVTGPLTAPLVAGRLDVDRAEITVPERLPTAGTLINLQHMGLPADVAETLRRAEVGPFAKSDEGGSGASGASLDVLISAPARVFIRGRGIDAELGGEVRITGPVSDVSPVGRFELIRGRLSILGQRIEFTEGSITLIGDLNPTIRLVAETRRNDVTVRVILDGPASDPVLTIESSPVLPEDEALAQLLFGRGINELSPFQLAQLAAGVAELAGSGGGPSVLEQLRVFTGLDNLEITTDDEGNPAAQAGAYIADNIYLGVRAGEQSSGVTVNVDISRHLTVRAEALTDRETVGIFYEREY